MMTRIELITAVATVLREMLDGVDDEHTRMVVERLTRDRCTASADRGCYRKMRPGERSCHCENDE